MRNKKAQIMFIWFIIGALLLLTVFALIDPLKDGALAPADSAMNCSNPASGYKGSCIVIRWALIWFVLAIGYFIFKFIINKSRGQ
jgi:hypothetical protein